MVEFQWFLMLLSVLPNKYFQQNSSDFPLVVDRKGTFKDLFEKLKQDGYDSNETFKNNIISIF